MSKTILTSTLVSGSITSTGSFGDIRLVNPTGHSKILSNDSLVLGAKSVVSVNIDYDGNQTDRAFIVRNNTDLATGGTELFRVNEDGNSIFAGDVSGSITSTGSFANLLVMGGGSTAAPRFEVKETGNQVISSSNATLNIRYGGNATTTQPGFNINGNNMMFVANSTEVFRASSGGHFIVNENGTDVNTRIETNNQTNTFTVDGATDKVAIGVGLGGAHDEKFKIAGDVGVTGSLHVSGNITTSGSIIAKEFRTEFVNQIIATSSGSTTFGDSVDDIHRFTGSIFEFTGSALRVVDNALLGIGSSTDLNISHNGTNGVISEGTGNLTIRTLANDKDVIFQSDDGSGGVTSYITLDGSATKTIINKSMRFADDIKAMFGAGEDLEIYHDGSNTYIENETGDFQIFNKADDKDVILSTDDGSGGTTAYITLDGSTAKLILQRPTFIGSHHGAADSQLHVSESYMEAHIGSGSLMTVFETKGTSGNPDFKIVDKDNNNARAALQVQGNAGAIECLFVASAGNVGVGTSSPAQKLDVAGNTKLGSSISHTHDITGCIEVSGTLNIPTGSITVEGGIGGANIARFSRNQGTTRTDIDIHAGSGDPQITFSTPSRDFSIGASAGGHEFRISEHTAIGTDNRLIVRDDGDVFISQSLDFGAYHATDKIVMYNGGNEKIGTAANTLVFTADNFDFRDTDGHDNLQVGSGEVVVNEDSQDVDFRVESNNHANMLFVDGGNDNIAIGNTTADATLHIGDSSTGIFTLGTASGSTIDLFKLEADLTNAGQLIHRFEREATGSDWTTAGLKILARTDVTEQAWIKFNGAGNNYGLAFGAGTGGNNLAMRIDTNKDVTIQAGGLSIPATEKLIFDSGSGHTYISETANDVVDHYVGGTNLLRLEESGTDYVQVFDSTRLAVGTGKDLQIYHDASNSYVQNTTAGHLIIQNDVNDHDIQLHSDDGSGGTTEYLRIDGSLTRMEAFVNLKFGDNIHAIFGASNDLEIYHDGTNSVIHNDTNELVLSGSAVRIANGNLNLTSTSNVSGSMSSTGSFGNVIINGLQSDRALRVSGSINAQKGLRIGRGTSGQKRDMLVLEKNSNDNDAGIAFLNTGGSFSGTMFASSSKGDIVFANDIVSGTISNQAPAFIISSSADLSMNQGARLYMDGAKIGSNPGDTYIHSDATDSIEIVVGGRNNLTVDDTNGVIINEGSYSTTDFRVESNNQTHMIFADAGNDYLGIATSAPYERLYVNCEDANSPGIVSNPSQTNGAVAYAIGYGDANKDYLNTWGMSYSAGATVFGYGLKPHSGSDATFVNSADNSNFTRGALYLDNELRFFTAGATTGTIDTTITTTERMRIETDGEAHFDGDVVAFSSTVSDKRLKENVIEIDGALDTIHNLRGVTFNWKDELKVSEKRRGKLDYGFIAQEVEAILPELVKESKSLIRESKDGPKEEETIYKTVSYPKVIPILVEAVKELTTEIEDLKKEIKKLKK